MSGGKKCLPGDLLALSQNGFLLTIVSPQPGYSRDSQSSRSLFVNVYSFKNCAGLLLHLSASML